ncbi:MAG: hypothetical protein DRN90_03615 [Thermoproteota archaeon]|nr:MAG: hypothetical protein DRN90_03615 [Candidatus Korarchaeota archaeon]
MEPLTKWIDFLTDVLSKVASQGGDIALVHHITPDGIIAALFLKKALESLDAPVEVIPSLPEDLLFTMENIDTAGALILVDFVPLGPGPASVAHEFFPGGFLIFDHESIDLGYDLKETVRLNPRTFSLNVPCSYSAYLAAEKIDPSSQNLSWLIQVGVYGESPGIPNETYKTEGIRGQEDVSMIYRAIYSLSSILGVKGARIAFSTLEGSIGELSILDKENPLHAFFWDEANRCWEKITGELSRQPKIKDENLVAHQISNPELRFFVAELGLKRYDQNLSVAYYCDDVLARVCVRSRPLPELNVYERIRVVLSAHESSVVGREDYADICIRSEFLDDLLGQMVDLL